MALARNPESWYRANENNYVYRTNLSTAQQSCEPATVLCVEYISLCMDLSWVHSLLIESKTEQQEKPEVMFEKSKLQNSFIAQ